MNVLIIDDEKTILKTVTTQLAEMKLQLDRVDTAESAARARALMEQCKYDIFLCDIVMPQEDGISFAKWVLEQTRDVKIVFLTSYADVKYMKEAISMQSFDYVLQPVATQELQKVVERAIRQLKIERRNMEMIQKGSFFQQHEDSILEVEALRYLEGRTDEASYIGRMIRVVTGKGEDASGFMPVQVQVLRNEEKLEKIEESILRLIYQNILDEVFRDLGVYSIILLQENSSDFVVILCWDKEDPPETEAVLDTLEGFRELALRVMGPEIAIYCGTSVEREELQGCLEPIRVLMKDNVRRESLVAYTGEINKEKSDHSHQVQIGIWEKLLEQKQFNSFR
ncbi:MAG: response regulator, partial [Lachnospiraceae bacterium]|nr:response regulator [Lachnospiraceae bacterium]